MCAVNYFLTTYYYLLLLQCTTCARTSPILSLLFFMHGISDSPEQSSKQKREKALLQSSRLGMQRSKTLLGAVSADVHIQHSSVDDDLITHAPPYKVLALTSRCHMWLHVAYGV